MADGHVLRRGCRSLACASPRAVVQDLLTQCPQTQHQAEAHLLPQAGSHDKPLCGCLWHVERETRNTLRRKHTEPSWRCLGIVQKPCCCRLGMTSVSVGLSLLCSLLLPVLSLLVNACFLIVCSLVLKLLNATVWHPNGNPVKQICFRGCPLLPSLWLVPLGVLPNPRKHVSPL